MVAEHCEGGREEGDSFNNRTAAESGRCDAPPVAKPPSTHADQQGRDGSAVFQVDHGQQVRQVTLSGPRKAQPAARR